MKNYRNKYNFFNHVIQKKNILTLLNKSKINEFFFQYF